MLDLHPIEDRLAAAWPPSAWRDMTVLVAVSGGADSVATLRAMGRLKDHQGAGRLCVAHFNHHLRGAESAGDEAFVVTLAARLELECRVGHRSAKTAVALPGNGLEATARAARYDFFQQTAEQLGARYVVTAHSADDQAETILHRILRGTGIAGLAGISRARALGRAATVIRPLLGVHRSDLVRYLQDLGQDYRGDSSNRDLRFTRNRIRHDLLPRLAGEYNEGVVDALLRLGGLAREVQTVVETLVDDLAQQCLTQENSASLRVATSCLAMQPRYIVRELLIAAWRRQRWPLQAMGLAQWDQLADMVYHQADRPHAAVRKQVFPGSVRASIDEDQLHLERQ